MENTQKRNPVLDGLAVFEGKMTSKTFGQNFRNGSYDTEDLKYLFSHDPKNSDKIDEFNKKFEIDDKDAAYLNIVLKDVNSAIAESLYSSVVTRHPVQNLNPYGEIYNSEREVEKSETSQEVLGLLKDAFRNYPKNFVPYTAYKIYFHPQTPETNPKGLENLTGLQINNSNWERGNEIISINVGNMLGIMENDVRQDLKKQQPAQVKSSQKVNEPAQKPNMMNLINHKLWQR